MTENHFGWLPPEMRTDAQHEADEAARSMMPAFAIEGYREERGRFATWALARQANGGEQYPYAWQVTGSCVGAGGGNMLRTLARVEISQGDPEEYHELWWPYTYGQSRLRAGWSREGEGSWGTTWAAAIVQDGIFAASEAQGLPEFTRKGGWLQLSKAVEMKWSAGGWSKSEYGALALKHPVGTAAKISSSDEAKAALQNGYPLTLASNFGTRGSRPQGTPAVNVAERDDRWPHQMFCDEAWDHPTLGLIFRIGNNWGPTGDRLGGTGPRPTQGEPEGGFYVLAKTFDGICRENEVFAFSKFTGFLRRSLDWIV